MKKTCEKCKTEFAAIADYQTLCLLCYRATKQPTAAAAEPAAGSGGPPSYKDTRILRQVLLKIASEQVKGTPEQLIEYARKLEKAWQEWKP